MRGLIQTLSENQREFNFSVEQQEWLNQGDAIEASLREDVYIKTQGQENAKLSFGTYEKQQNTW